MNDGFPAPSSRGQDIRGAMGTGMGPRIREDSGWGPGSTYWGEGGGKGGGRNRGWFETSPYGMKGMQWGVATVGGVGGLSEGAKATGTGMGPRIREDNGWG